MKNIITIITVLFSVSVFAQNDVITTKKTEMNSPFVKNQKNYQNDMDAERDADVMLVSAQELSSPFIKNQKNFASIERSLYKGANNPEVQDLNSPFMKNQKNFRDSSPSVNAVARR